MAVTLRALGAEATARATLPFGVLLPGAIWVGVSADGLFAGVLAWGVALLALGATRPRLDILASLLVAGVGVAAVVAAFVAVGFWWLQGYQQVTLRYIPAGGVRPGAPIQLLGVG